MIENNKITSKTKKKKEQVIPLILDCEAMAEDKRLLVINEAPCSNVPLSAPDK